MSAAALTATVLLVALALGAASTALAVDPQESLVPRVLDAAGDAIWSDAGGAGRV